MATNTAVRTPLDQPSLSWRMSSSFILGATSMLCRGFLYGLNTVETTGLDRFLEILDQRKDVDKRERGLITGGALSTFFSLGQVLPTHRASYSPHGGAFQATIPQAIRLLSAQPFGSLEPGSLDAASSKALGATDIHDPFTSGDGLTYSTDGNDSFVAPSIYAQNRLAWVHIFPEGCIHQHPSMTMRYFKWGVARLILESEPMPDMLPMFIDGTQNIMSEERTFPHMEAKFGDLRRKWQELVRKDRLRALGKAENDAAAKTRSSNSSWASLSSLWSSKSSSKSTPETTTPSSSSSSDSDSQLQLQQQSTTLQSQKRTSGQLAMGELSEELKYGAEAQALRIEVARRVRDEIEKLRVSLGYPEDDPKLALAETWAKEPAGARRFKSEVDGSLVTKE
ncbi:hypothetical protein PG997_012825 [Apiospora hydei]|uniref:Tafazzin family protein n=1 Tax=Apiospora hydei TaxID=1337664 RepID=A0ABR1V7X5_9PEZI